MDQLIQPSELQILVLAVALTPVMAWAFRGIDLPRKWWLAAAITAISTSYVATVIEGFVAEDFFNTIEHLAIAVAGACFIMVALQVLRWPLDEEADGDRR